MTALAGSRRTYGPIAPAAQKADPPAGLARQPKTAVDYDLERRIALFLSQRGVPRKRNFQVNAECGTVTLRGRLPSPQAKRYCLECCRHVAGVIRIIDQLEVETAEAGRGRPERGRR